VTTPEQEEGRKKRFKEKGFKRKGDDAARHPPPSNI
jgi:hypothetical protein